jgi:hypothetical protein
VHNSSCHHVSYLPPALSQRESALLDLSKRREAFPDLAPILWHSHGTIAALIQEVVGVYPLLSPPTLSPTASNRVCNALALLQCVASHPETKSKLMNAHIPLYLYPFLNTVSKLRPFEFLRLTSLGVIGALVKVCISKFFSKFVCYVTYCVIILFLYHSRIIYCFLCFAFSV